MQLNVITGMSGSGKTQALKFLEDNGFFCIDNLPPALILKLSELVFKVNQEFEKIALVIDIRVGNMIDELLENLEMLKENGYQYKLLFLTAKDDELVKRFKETRHNHPIESDDGLLGSIRLEKKRLEKIYAEADFVVDTSDLSINEFHKKLRNIYFDEGIKKDKIDVNIVPFGFKYGLPMDSDLVFDVRCFPNPFYVPELKNKTGNDKKVYDYVMNSPDTISFYNNMSQMIKQLLPLYYNEGKTLITISIGCTGGKHRSVSIANRLSEDLKEQGYMVNVIYRDIEKGR